MWDNITYFFRRKYRQIRNVFRWLPIIWNQFDFDYRYATDVFRFQLEKIADFMESDRAMATCSKQRAQRIRMVLRLMDKVYDEEYACEYQHRLKEAYGEDVIDWDFFPVEDKPGCSTMKYRYETDEKYKDIREEIKENSNKWFKESHEKQMRAHKLLWDLIEHNIRGWWD